MIHLKFLITRHVYILILLLLTSTSSSSFLRHRNMRTDDNIKLTTNIELVARNGTIFNYNPKDRLGKGAFGEAIIGERTEQVAMKIENVDEPNTPMLYIENQMYAILNGQVGIPHLFDFFIYFQEKQLKAVLVIELLGKSLDYYLNKLKKFSIKTSMMIGLQILEVIETIHNKGIIHSDMKPSNLAVGREDKSIIYIFDFGLSTFYINNGEHIKESKDSGRGAGTMEYMSLYAHTHPVLSRAADIESIAYILIEFLNGRIWSTDNNDEILNEKANGDVETIAGNVCSETMQQFLIYSRDLGFYDKPDYAHLKKMLSNELDKHQFENDGDFDWRRLRP